MKNKFQHYFLISLSCNNILFKKKKKKKKNSNDIDLLSLELHSAHV